MITKTAYCILLFLSLCLLSPFVSTIAVDTNLSVTATVPAQASDFQTSISSTATASEPYPQNTEIVYTITYGSTLNQATSFTLQAEWFTGSIAGGGSADVVDYVVNTASTGYGGATPVIDTINKTISWDIVDLPANTVDHTVSFTLKNNSNYTGSSVVTFTTASRILGPGVNTTDQEIDLTYKYVTVLLPTSTPTPTLQTTSAPGPSATPVANIPTPTIIKNRSSIPSPKFDTIEITELTSNFAEVYLATNLPLMTEFYLSTDKQKFSKYETMLDQKKIRKISLNGLSPETKYYFKIIAYNNNGIKITSDMFTFETAKNGQEAMIDYKTSFISWNQLIVASVNSPIVHAPKNKPITINVPVDNHENITSITLRFENTNVLGIQEKRPIAPTHQISLIQAVPGIFSGEILTPSVSGKYEIILSIREESGAFYTQSLPYSIFVGPSLTFVNKNNNLPIENVEVIIEKKQKSNTHEIILGKSFAITETTDENGELDIILSSGEYSAKVYAPGFAREEFSFILDEKNENYPKLMLTPSGFFTERVTYFIRSSQDIVDYLSSSLRVLATSPRGQEISFIVLFILTSLRAIFVIRNHTQGLIIKTKKMPNTYLGWTIDLLQFTLTNLLVALNILFTILVFKMSNLQVAIPFCITTLLSLITWNISTKDGFEKYC